MLFAILDLSTDGSAFAMEVRNGQRSRNAIFAGVFAIVVVALLLYSCRGVNSDLGIIDGSDDDAPEVLLVMDASGSMGAPVGDQTRSEAANDAFDGLLDAMPSDAVMGLAVMRGGCTSRLDTIEPSPLTTDVKVAYRSAIDNSTVTDAPSGGRPATPVGRTLAVTAELFSERATSKTLVLISDGEEGCGDPPCDVARQLIDSGFEVQVEAIGFQISDVGADQLECVARATGGSYHDIDDPSELEQTLVGATTGDDGLAWWPFLVAALGIALAWLALVGRKIAPTPGGGATR